MKYTIVITKKSEYVYALLKRKIERSKSIKMTKNEVKGKGAILIEAEAKDNEGDLAVVKIISDVIVENMQLRFLVETVKRRYAFLEERAQCDILIKTLRLLWFRKKDKVDNYTLTKLDIEKRVKKYFEEAKKNEIILDGFLNFRLQDHKKAWEDMLKRVVQGYILEKDYRDFISILRYFVSMKKPIKRLVNLKYKDNKYVLSDEDDNEIDCKAYESKLGLKSGMSASDLILSMLINLAPEKIMLYDYKDFPDKKFVVTVKNVFSKRVFLKSVQQE